MSRREVESIGKKHSTSTGTARILGSFDLYCDPEEKSLGFWLSSTGFWESWITVWILENIREGDVCLDVGANYGYFARIMQFMAKENGKVYAVEANPTLALSLAKSNLDFGIQDSAPLEILQVAAWNKSENLKLTIDPHFLGGSSVSNSEVFLGDDPTHLVVPGVPLDSLINEHVTFLKMDIEGAEPFAWEGMRNITKSLRVGILEINQGVSQDFVSELEDDFELSLVDYTGGEEKFTREVLNQDPNPRMLVIRRRN
jgi:FkbM family methyltransferase